MGNVFKNIFLKLKQLCQPDQDIEAEKADLQLDIEADDSLPLETALMVLMIDVASSDSEFARAEKNIIYKYFETSLKLKTDEVSVHMAHAQNIINNFRGGLNFCENLKLKLPLEKRQEVLQQVADIISADGVSVDFEAYLKERFQKALL